MRPSGHRRLFRRWVQDTIRVLCILFTSIGITYVGVPDARTPMAETFDAVGLRLRQAFAAPVRLGTDAERPMPVRRSFVEGTLNDPRLTFRPEPAYVVEPVGIGTWPYAALPCRQFVRDACPHDLIVWPVDSFVCFPDDVRYVLTLDVD